MDPATDALDPNAAGADTDNPNKIDNPDLAYIFKANRDHFPAKPYYDDGNPEMYTVENRKKRDALKQNPIVMEAIQAFKKENFVPSGSKNNQVYSKEEYFKVFVKVGMILRPGIHANDLTAFIKEDFDNDSAEPVEVDEKG